MYFSLEIILMIIIVIIIIICIFTYNAQNQQINELNQLKNKLNFQNLNTPEAQLSDMSNNSNINMVNDNLNYNDISNKTNINMYDNNKLNILNNNKTNNPIIIDETIIKPSKPPLVDPIKVYDYRVLEDPMKEPTRRLPSYIIGSGVNPYAFNYPTRGLRDSFSLQGYLVDYKASSNDQNKILQLFGRQKWPNSSQYEYYITFQSGNKDRKYDLEKYKKELYDKDEVLVDILNDRKYEVKLFKQESMEYNPFWF